jgi:energy-coupling factor transport system permease protein
VIAQVYGKRGASALHHYDPRTKAALLLAFLVLFFLPIPVWHLGAYLAVVLVVSGIFIGLPNTLRPIRLILPILILVLLLTPPFHRQGAALLAIRGFTVLSVSGLLLALRLIVRFSGITLAFYLFIGTTDPDELILAFRWFRLPYSVSLVLSLALGYIPTIRTLYDQVREAHQLRLAGEGEGFESAGARPRAGALFKRLREAVPILTSVLIVSVRRIPTLAMALECRGVGRKNPRTSYHTLKSGGAFLRDGTIAAAGIAVLVVPFLLFP